MGYISKKSDFLFEFVPLLLEDGQVLGLSACGDQTLIVGDLPVGIQSHRLVLHVHLSDTFAGDNSHAAIRILIQCLRRRVELVF